MNITEFLTSSSIALIALFTPIILAVVELSKKWIANDRWYPIIAILAGVLLSWFFSDFSATSYKILLGVLSGLAASGLYSGSRTVVGK